MKRLSGVFDFTENLFLDSANNIQCAQVGDTTCQWIGSPSPRTTATIEDTFAGAEPTKHLNGIYLAAVHDPVAKELRLYQDRSTSPFALYYTTNNGKFYYSTSLKWLLKESGISRHLNQDAVQTYLRNGYIWGKDTLVEGVYKLAPFSWLSVTADGVELHKAEYPFSTLTESEAISQWRSVLDAAILQGVAGEERLCTALSSGYDSNYILHVLHRDTELPIDCFSVGGKFGKNELPQVTENAREYSRVSLHTALTDNETLSTLPDIVWRLEGAVFEVGNFLQYELNHALAEADVHKIVCGECADQVMQEWYFTEERIGELPKNTYFSFDEYPFVYGHSVILKKNGILGNSFGIESHYPFLDNDFVEVAQALRRINMTDKRYHVRVCREELHPTILKNISKIGGATEVHSLFDTEKDAKKFLGRVRASKLFRSYGDHCIYGGYARKQLEAEVNSPKNKLRALVYKLLGRNNNNSYYLAELQLREALCYLSVILFEELILSGKYDSLFNEDGISERLSAFGY